MLELLSNLTKESIVAPTVAIASGVERLKVQHNVLHGKAGWSREHLLARESELVAELSNAKVKTTDIKTSFETNAARVLCFEGQHARHKTTQAEGI